MANGMSKNEGYAYGRILTEAGYPTGMIAPSNKDKKNIQKNKYIINKIKNSGLESLNKDEMDILKKGFEEMLVGDGSNDTVVREDKANFGEEFIKIGTALGKKKNDLIEYFNNFEDTITRLNGQKLHYDGNGKAEKKEYPITTQIRLNKQVYQDILDNVMGQMSDGLWENSNNAKNNSFWEKYDVNIDDNGKIKIEKREKPYQYHSGDVWEGVDKRSMGEYLTGKLSAVINTEKKDNPNKTYEDDTYMEYLNCSYGDAKKLLKLMKNLKTW